MDRDPFSRSTTLVIPVHRGRERALERLLLSVANTAPSAFSPVEILIVSRDIPDIETHLSALSRAFPFPIRSLYVPDARTLAELRNAGLHAVATEWVHFLDSDTFLAPDHFLRLERAVDAQDRSIACFQFDFEPAPTRSLWARYEAEIDRWAIGQYVRSESVRGLNGMGFLARVEVLRALGGFDSTLVAAEDIELGYRLSRAGVPIAFLGDIRIVHEYPLRLRDLMRRKFWHGQGYGLFLARHPEFPRQFLATSRPSLSAIVRRPLFFAYALVSHIVFFAGAVVALWRARSRRASSRRSAHSALAGARAERPTCDVPSETLPAPAPRHDHDDARRERA
ncbi:MAG: glycosyltransferase [Blastocatellia bacterium]|nr:glycosyltransferase [Blastocatellia bacterium]